MALGLTPTTLSFIAGNGSPAPSAGVTDVLQNGVSVVDNGVARVTVPTNTSDLQNDSGFITSASVPTKTSDLQNDSGFITSSDLPTVDQTYNAASTNAQSGVAVAQAIASITPGGGGTTLNHLRIESSNHTWSTVANKEIAQVTYSAAFKFTFGSAPSDVIPVTGYSAGIVRINIENYLPPYATFDSVVLQIGRNITVKSSNVQNSVSYNGGVLDRFQIADIPYFCSTGFGGDYDLFLVFLNNGTPVLPGRFELDIIRLF